MDRSRPEVEPWSKEGKPSIAKMDSMTLGAMDKISPTKGLLLVEQTTRRVFVEDSVLIVVKEHKATCSTTMVVNTYNRRYSKCLKERDLGNEKALVVWVKGIYL